MFADQVDIKTPEYVSIKFQPAGLGSRAAAFIIDTLLLFVVNLIILVILLFVLSSDPALYWMEMSTVPMAITIILLFLVNFGYHFVLEYFWGGKTIGKKVIGIRVIQDNGHSLTLLSAFIRNLLRIIDSLPTSYLLGMIMVFFHSKHKRIGDLVAGTIVVHERKAAKMKKKLTPIEREIAQRALTKEQLDITEWQLKTIGSKEWKLVKTYIDRFMQLNPDERYNLTSKLANIMANKLGVDISNYRTDEMENFIFVLYLHLKEDWEYEL